MCQLGPGCNPGVNTGYWNSRLDWGICWINGIMEMMLQVRQCSQIWYSWIEKAWFDLTNHPYEGFECLKYNCAIWVQIFAFKWGFTFSQRTIRNANVKDFGLWLAIVKPFWFPRVNFQEFSQHGIFVGLCRVGLSAAVTYLHLVLCSHRHTDNKTHYITL